MSLLKTVMNRNENIKLNVLFKAIITKTNIIPSDLGNQSS